VVLALALVAQVVAMIKRLFKNYENPPELIPVQAFTIQSHMLLGLLICVGLVVGRLFGQCRL